MCEALGYNVRKLKRVRVMNILVDGLKTGEWQDLNNEERDELFKQLDYQPKR